MRQPRVTGQRWIDFTFHRCAIYIKIHINNGCIQLIKIYLNTYMHINIAYLTNKDIHKYSTDMCTINTISPKGVKIKSELLALARTTSYQVALLPLRQSDRYLVFHSSTVLVIKSSNVISAAEARASIIICLVVKLFIFDFFS